MINIMNIFQIEKLAEKFCSLAENYRTQGREGTTIDKEVIYQEKIKNIPDMEHVKFLQINELTDCKKGTPVNITVSAWYSPPSSHTEYSLYRGMYETLRTPARYEKTDKSIKYQVQFEGVWGDYNMLPPGNIINKSFFERIRKREDIDDWLNLLKIKVSNHILNYSEMIERDLGMRESEEKEIHKMRLRLDPEYQMKDEDHQFNK